MIPEISGAGFSRPRLLGSVDALERERSSKGGIREARGPTRLALGMISVAIAKHPKRRLSQVALSRLAPLAVEVIDGTGLSLWRSMQAAWLAGRGTHHIVMHDDIMPCEGFPELAEAFVRKHPATPISFLSPLAVTEPMNGAIATNTFPCGGALCLPSRLIVPFIAWCAQHIDPSWIMDDDRFALWCCATGRRILAPVPNLVQHFGVESVAVPGNKALVSASYRDAPGPIEWSSEVAIVPGDPIAYTRSRQQFFLRH